MYSLNGDLLKVVEEQRVEVKSVFLNSREDYLCVAANLTPQDQPKRGWLRVLSLYGLEIVADLSTLVYDKTMNVVVDRKNKSKSPDGNPNELMPPIQAMAVGLHERNINIFLVK